MKRRRSTKAKIAASLLVAASITALAACGVAGRQATAPAPASASDATALQAACPSLTGMTIPASAIGLPSGTASIESATFVPAVAQAVSGTTATPATPEYCKVLGSVAPRDPRAQPINFQLNLPTR